MRGFVVLVLWLSSSLPNLCIWYLVSCNDIGNVSKHSSCAVVVVVLRCAVLDE